MAAGSSPSAPIKARSFDVAVLGASGHYGCCVAAGYMRHLLHLSHQQQELHTSTGSSSDQAMPAASGRSTGAGSEACELPHVWHVAAVERRAAQPAELMQELLQQMLAGDGSTSSSAGGSGDVSFGQPEHTPASDSHQGTQHATASLTMAPGGSSSAVPWRLELPALTAQWPAPPSGSFPSHGGQAKAARQLVVTVTQQVPGGSCAEAGSRQSGATCNSSNSGCGTGGEATFVFTSAQLASSGPATAAGLPAPEGQAAVQAAAGQHGSQASAMMGQSPPLLKVTVITGLDATQQAAMQRLASRSALLVNVVRYSRAPYQAALDACKACATHYIDISADPAWIDSVLTGVSSTPGGTAADQQPGRTHGTASAGSPGAASRGPAQPCVLVPGCGFDYLLPCLAALHAVRALPPGAQLLQLRSTLQVVLGPRGLLVRRRTLEEVLLAMAGQRTASSASVPATGQQGKEQAAPAAASGGSSSMAGAEASSKGAQQEGAGWGAAVGRAACAAAGVAKAVWQQPQQALPLWYNSGLASWVMQAPGCGLEQRLVGAMLRAHCARVLPAAGAGAGAGGPAAAATGAVAAAARPEGTAGASDAGGAHIAQEPAIICRLAMPSLLLELPLLALAPLAALLAQLRATRQLLLLLAPTLASWLGARVTSSDAEALQSMDSVSFRKRYELQYIVPKGVLPAAAGERATSQGVEGCRGSAVAGGAVQGGAGCELAGGSKPRTGPQVQGQVVPCGPQVQGQVVPCGPQVQGQVVPCGAVVRSAVVDVVGAPGCMKDLTVCCLLAAGLGLLLEGCATGIAGGPSTDAAGGDADSLCAVAGRREVPGGSGGAVSHAGVPARVAAGARCVALGPGELLGSGNAWQYLCSLGLFTVQGMQ